MYSGIFYIINYTLYIGFVEVFHVKKRRKALYLKAVSQSHKRKKQFVSRLETNCFIGRNKMFPC